MFGIGSPTTYPPPCSMKVGELSTSCSTDSACLNTAHLARWLRSLTHLQSLDWATADSHGMERLADGRFLSQRHARGVQRICQTCPGQALHPSHLGYLGPRLRAYRPSRAAALPARWCARPTCGNFD